MPKAPSMSIHPPRPRPYPAVTPTFEVDEACKTNCVQQIGIIRSSLMALTLISIEEDPQFYYIKCGNFDRDNIQISINFNRFALDRQAPPLNIQLEINGKVEFIRNVHTEQYHSTINAMLQQINDSVLSLCVTKVSNQENFNSY